MSECRSTRERKGAGRLKRLLGCLAEALRESLTAIAFAALLFGIAHETTNPAPGPDADRLAAAGLDERPAGSQVEPAAAPWNPKHRILATYLSRRYSIAPDAAEEWVSAAYVASEQVGVDPLLVLAVIAIESSFDPNAVSLAGAEGLMQVVPKYHEEKLDEHGGSDAVRDPAINILVGARILEQYIRRSGSLEAALQRYNGALSDASGRYSRKVLAERGRLQRVIEQFEQALVVF